MSAYAIAIMIPMFLVPPIWYTCVKERRHPCPEDLVSVHGVLYDMQIIQTSYFQVYVTSRLVVNLECFFNGPIEKTIDDITTCPSENYKSWVDRLCVSTADWNQIIDEEVTSPSAGKVFVYPGSTAFLFDSSSKKNNKAHLISATDLKWMHPAKEPYVMLRSIPELPGYVFERIDSIVARKLSPPMNNEEFVNVLRSARDNAVRVQIEYHRGFLGQQIRAEVHLFDQRYMFVSNKFLRDGQSDESLPIVEFRDEQCIVCLHPMSLMDEAVLACGHVYHEQCIRNWLERSGKCPHCSTRAHIVSVRKN